MRQISPGLPPYAVPTVAALADLPAGAASGARYTVAADGLTYVRAGELWLPDFLAGDAKYGAPLSGVLYALAAADIASQITPAMFRTAQRALISGTTLRVAVGADSTGLGGDTSPWCRDRWTDRLVDSLRGAGLSVEEGNFAIGGRTLAQMVDPNYKALAAEPSDIAAGFYRPDFVGWTVGRSWLDHIRAWAPHILLIGHGGMNDASRGFAGVKQYVTDLNGLLDTVQGWTPAPDPVIASTFEPTSRADSVANPPRYVRAYANASRTVARRRGVALVDAHRLDRVLREGVDSGLTQTLPLLRWAGLEDGSEWIYDPARWSITRTGTGPTDPSRLAPSNNDTNERVVTSRRLTASGVLIVDVVCPSSAALGGVGVQHRDGLGLLAILTPAGSANGPARLDVLDLAHGNALLGSLPLTWSAGQVLSLRWTYANGAHTLNVTDAEGGKVLTVDAPYVSWEGAVRFVSLGGDFQTAEYRNLQWYAGELLGRERTAPIVREEEVLGRVFPTRWPATVGNRTNHEDPLGHAVIHLAATSGVVRVLGSFTQRPLGGAVGQGEKPLAAGETWLFGLVAPGVPGGAAVALGTTGELPPGVLVTTRTVPGEVHIRITNVSGGAVTVPAMTYTAAVVA